MSERGVEWADRLGDVEMSRRRVIGALAGGGVVLGSAKAIDNVMIGYGPLTGTNLVEQDLETLAAADFHPSDGFAASDGEHVVETTPTGARVTSDDDLLVEAPFEGLTPDAVAEHDLPEWVTGLLLDVGAVARGEATFEFHRTDDFFERIERADDRPLAVGALRRWPAADANEVEGFADADPADPQAVLEGLVDGFRAHTHYDVPRYVAGSIEDNVIFGAADLRAPFEDPVEFDDISSGPQTGLFCYEFTYRSIEAIHAVPATEQVAPVVGASVVDDRHKHVYTGVASLVREGDDVVIPMTFVDYTHTTLYDDLHLRGVLGEGFDAYDRRHRATEIVWDPFV